ncbi:pectinesterase family protein [Cellvibrio sp. OA-2007]|uniref:pectinesterase family protein n=1 Tax=Cellvibrio sp. OA-2007 TaxID=529823 RepID=UPI0007834142|nr:pectinesterase family protein [Cellvibrio sp. OA-2007]
MIARQLFRILCIVLYAFIISGCISQSGVHYDARVDPAAESTDKIFPNIQSALDAAPTNAIEPYRILIAAGNYYEKIIIAKPNIYLIGENKQNTRIYYDAYAGQQSTDTAASKGQIWGTPGSATVIVRAANVQLHQLTIENSFDFLTNDALANDDHQRIANSQAVALFLDNGSDRFLARDVRLLGYQDTLFVNAGRSWFDRSFIAGNVDFIFGKGNALFTESEIHTLGRGKPNYPHGYLVAPSTQIVDEYGLTFINCRLTRAESVPDNSVPLGRPWHPTTQFADGRYADSNAIGKAVFIGSWMDAHITRDGWYAMNGTAKDGTKVPFMPEDARFFEYQNTGPGAQVNVKRRQLTEVEVQAYTQEKILGDWRPTP